MKKEDYHYLGYIMKALGTKGGLLVALDSDDIEKYEELESVFILIEGKLVPFFIEEIILRPAAKEAVIHFEDINTVDQARHLCDKEAYLPLESSPPSEENAFYHQGIKGYQAYQASGEYIGEIDKILDFPGNPVFSIIKDTREILIPVADELITEINHEEKKIYLTPPPGLLELYQ